jgi:hypothetical protein
MIDLFMVELLCLLKFDNRLLTQSTEKQNGFSFLNGPMVEGKTTNLFEPPVGFEPTT